MCVYKVIVFLILITRIHCEASEENVASSSCAGFAFELLITRLDYLYGKLTEMEATIKQDREITDKKLSSAIKEMSEQMYRNLTQLHTKSDSIVQQHLETFDRKLTHQERMSEGLLLAINEQSFSVGKRSSQDTEAISKAQNAPVLSCERNPAKVSGKYLIQPAEYTKPFVGYCEQTAFGGGWLVFQYRYDGSVDFYRNWAEYRDGFGTVDGEFWLGLEYLHRLTTARPHELLVELKDFSGKYLYARYSEFEIGSEEEGYALKKLGSYKGTAKPSFTGKNYKFTTKDRDNDIKPQNSAIVHHGAWWYVHSTNANLNGRYQNGNDEKNMFWFFYKNDYTGLAYSRMSIREK